MAPPKAAGSGYEIRGKAVDFMERRFAPRDTRLRRGDCTKNVQNR